MRARSVMGAFGGTGSYATSASGNREVGFEEDLFGAVRLGSHLQVGLWAPFVQTSRQAGSLSGWGGGLGDVAANVRFDAVNAGDAWRLAGGRAAGGALGPDRPAPRRSGRPAGDVGHRNRIVRRQRRGRDRRDRRQGLRVDGGLGLAAQRAHRRRRRAVVRAAAVGACCRAATRSGTTPPSARSRSLLRQGDARDAERRDREQRRRAGHHRRGAGAAVLGVVAAAGDAVQRRPDRRLGAQSDRSGSAAPWRSSASGSDDSLAGAPTDT